MHTDALVPGGILETDKCHVMTDDGTCSRCGKEIGEDEMPVRFWDASGHLMWTYCEDCHALNFGPQY